MCILRFLLCFPLFSSTYLLAQSLRPVMNKKLFACLQLNSYIYSRDKLSKHVLLITFLTCPRIPLTVRMAAPSNLATSKSDVNIPLISAVFLNILHGVPVSLIFFTILAVLLNSWTHPVAVILNGTCENVKHCCKVYQSTDIKNDYNQKRDRKQINQK